MTERSSNKALAYCIAILTLMALVVPFVGTALANHPPDVCLDVDPETSSNPTGTTHSVTATLRQNVAAPAADDACHGPKVNADDGAVNIDFRIEGPNDPNPENTLGTADFSCDIPQGESSCLMPAYTGTSTGIDLIRGWIDHDKVQSTVEADEAEGRNDVQSPGTGDDCNLIEPDCTDVVSKTWTAGEPAAVDCDDSGPPNTEREVNPSNEGSASTETYTCTVTDARGNPVGKDQQVYGEVENGVNDPDPQDGASYESPDYGCVTTSSGTCTVQVTQNEGETGTAEICFWIGTTAEGGDAQHCGDEPTEEAQNPDGSDSPNDEADQVEKTWETRSASVIDAEPESDTNSPGEDHTITATVFDQFGQTFRGNTKVDFEFFQGSPSDNDGNTPSSPDLTCTTNDSTTCSVTYTSQETGTDLVCVYPDSSRPTMVGDNTNGTCDGEGLTDADDDPSNPDAPEPDQEGRVSDDQDVVQKRWAAPGEATRLDCNPETDSNPTDTSHTITCTARNQQDNVVGGVNIDAEATGANDPDNNSDTTSPDFSCTTDDSGSCSFTHGTGGTGTTSTVGTTTYRAWIDRDNDNTTAEADQTEGRDETTQPGNEAEPDNTDVVTKNWTGDARRIDCDPDTATNNVGTTHTVTCTVTDRAGNPASGEGVTFTETGAGDIQGSNRDTSDQNGQVTVTTTSNEAGEQTITGTLDDDTTGSEPGEVDECDRAINDPQGAPEGQCADTVTKTWTQDQPECSDGIDNDGDGRIDFPDDPGCESATDDDESDQFPNQEFGGEQGQPVGEGACAGFTTGSVQQDPDGSGLVIVGTNGNDALQGSEEGDLICALDGDDTVQGHGGNDTIHGGGGKDAIEAGLGDDEVFGDDDKDVILGDDGNDELFGGQGNDNMSGGAGEDVLRGQGGWDTLKGNAHDDLLVGARGNDILQGGGGNDVGRAGAGDDVLKGYTGNDELRGGGGEDLIRGSAGRDRLFGNAGNDVINGGPGKDRCRGGRGRDILRNCP